MEKPYTDEELNKYIDDTYNWVCEHPKILMHLVAKWIDEKYKKQNKNE